MAFSVPTARGQCQGLCHGCGAEAEGGATPLSEDLGIAAAKLFPSNVFRRGGAREVNVVQPGACADGPCHVGGW